MYFGNLTPGIYLNTIAPPPLLPFQRYFNGPYVHVIETSVWICYWWMNTSSALILTVLNFTLETSALIIRAVNLKSVKIKSVIIRFVIIRFLKINYDHLGLVDINTYILEGRYDWFAILTRYTILRCWRNTI